MPPRPLTRYPARNADMSSSSTTSSTNHRSTDLDVILNNTSVTPNTSATFDDGYKVKYKTGYDIDAILGYKLGIFRLEGEAGYKRAKVKSLGVGAPLVSAVGTASGTTATAADFDVGNHIGIKTLMGNALLDSNFGNSRLAAMSAAVRVARGRHSPATRIMPGRTRASPDCVTRPPTMSMSV